MSKTFCKLQIRKVTQINQKVSLKTFILNRKCHDCFWFIWYLGEGHRPETRPDGSERRHDKMLSCLTKTPSNSKIIKLFLMLGFYEMRRKRTFICSSWASKVCWIDPIYCATWIINPKYVQYSNFQRNL